MKAGRFDCGGTAGPLRLCSWAALWVGADVASQYSKTAPVVTIFTKLQNLCFSFKRTAEGQ